AEKLSIQVGRRGHAGLAKPLPYRIIGRGRGGWGRRIFRRELDQLQIGALGEFRDDANEHRTLGIHDYSAERSELEAAVMTIGIGRAGGEQVRLRSEEVQQEFPIPIRLVALPPGYFASGEPCG